MRRSIAASPFQNPLFVSSNRDSDLNLWQKSPKTVRKTSLQLLQGCNVFCVTVEEVNVDLLDVR